MPKHFTTRSDTLQDRLAKIPLKRLPKTFNEAIKITRKLGLRYIWIDSLCIIQDSLDDWRQESALMGKVYSHCFCMLAAVSSSNCHGGLFQTPTLYSVLRERDENDGKIVLLKPTARSWRDSLLESPLSRRGWTLQERELSPRILHFVDGVMHFECRQGFGEGKRSFDGYYSDEARAKTARTIRCMDPILARGGKVQWLESTAAIPEERYNRWLRMVEGYSQRKLSVLSDKFPAVSGLAAEYSYLLKDDYIAGLWRKDLIRGLCWRKGTKTPRSLVIDYGPSWSWAKIVGPVDYGLLQVIDNDGKEVNVAPIDCSSGNQNHQILPFIYDACTEPEGTDPNGTLTFALIRMRVKMIKLVFQQRTTWRVGNEIVEVVWDDKPNEFRSYYLLSLGKVNLGLVVTQTESQKDTYERVGIARITEKDPGTWFSNSVTQDISLI
ncbi:HET-domain-containing protein [Mollisia scopiformis]|uniref:HET-domain-containing protein n=1 Tax=Mollisia scopiformis TaxID=149040 RepID=A0A194XHR0_MOLSC|nr:HET-domain-containing protein [Mollisia scopiformis]KUJ19671.1 HET-domain-containing protein [Mollisia scopiformis]